MLIRLLLAAALSFFTVSSVHAYDATANFSQVYPELVAGWKIKAGSTKGGPYPSITDCKKPAPKADGTYDCDLVGMTVNPLYAVAVNYNSAGVESAPSSEASLTLTVPPPSQPRLAIKITTISRLTSYGNVIASTTISRRELGPNEVVKEGTSGYRNSKGQWVSNTTILVN